ncbi:MAG: hypothetical protein IJ343_01735 [Clostridia bacterium]|nr:hypothetical protein [Clostridia bacterium]
MKRRIIPRIVLGLVALLALVLLVIFVFIPLFDTSDEALSYVPVIHRFAGTEENFKLENDTLLFQLDPETTHFTVTDKRTGKVWSSIAPDIEKSSTQLNEKNRLMSIMTLVFMNSAGKEDKSYTSYDRSVANKLYSVDWEGEDAIRVTFTIGDIPREYIYPEAISGARMAELTAPLSKKEKGNLTDKYQEKGVNPETGKSLYKKSDDVAALEAMYPDLKEGTVWILRKAKSEQKKNDSEKIERYFASAGYTMEDYEYDQSRIVRDGETEGATDKPIFTISMIYRLEGDDLLVEVPLSDLIYNPNYPLTSLNLLPGFGSASNTENGYMLVPEGSGAIISFNNGKTKQPAYTADTYGWDYADIRTQVVSETHTVYPVFGVATQGSSFLCILEDGRAWSRINADVANRPGYGPYNSVNASYTIIHGDSYDVAQRSNTPVFMFEAAPAEGKLSQRYRFVASEDYMDMAAAYGEYLQAQYPDMNRQLDADAQTVVELVGAIDKVQQRWGVPTNVPIALTTYKQAHELLNRLVAEDLSNLSIRYAGWMNGGLNQSILNGVRLMSEMGSVNELKAFTKAASDAKVPLYLDGLTCFARDSGLSEGFVVMRDAARFTTREEAEIPEYSSIWYGPQDWRDTYFLLKPALILKGMDVLSSAADEYGAAGVAFRDVGSILSADYDAKDLTTREEARLQQAGKLASLHEKGQLIMTRTGHDYSVMLSDIVTDFDLDGTAYRIIDEVVPFYPAALHGMVSYTGPALNLAEDREELLLRSAEMGASLQFSLMASNVQELQDSWFSDYYGADASIVYDDMIKTLRKYNSDMSGVFNQKMTDHERVGNVTMTEYSNGTRVYVNYGYADTDFNGVVVPARSYITVKEAIE